MTPAQRDAEIVEKLLDIITALSGLVVGPTTMEAIGSIKIWPSNALPENWLLCYGQELALATYPTLGSLVGTTYGALTNGAGGAGTTHFRVPDLRGRVVAGQDDMGGTSANRLTEPLDGDILGNTAGSWQTQSGSAVGVAAGGDYDVLTDQAIPVIQPTMILNYIIKVL